MKDTLKEFATAILIPIGILLVVNMLIGTVWFWIEVVDWTSRTELIEK